MERVGSRSFSRGKRMGDGTRHIMKIFIEFATGGREKLGLTICGLQAGFEIDFGFDCLVVMIWSSSCRGFNAP
jgi:hypothetical protein